MNDLIRISTIAFGLSLSALGGAQASETRVCECGATIRHIPVPLPISILLPISVLPKPVGPAPIWSPPAIYRLPIVVNPIGPLPVATIAPKLPVMTPPILVSETINLQGLAGKVASPMFGAKIGQ
jgi:hypothetical protein